MVISALNRKLLRDLWNLKGQVLAIAMVIAGGVATFIISFSTIDSLVLTQQAFYRDNRFAEVFASVKRAPQRLEERILAIPGVERVQTRVVGMATLEVEDFTEPITGQLVSLPNTGQPELNQPYLREGRLPRRRASDEVVISEPFAEAHDLHPGDSLSAIINGRGKALTIVGIGLSPEFIYQIQPGALFPDYERYAILWLRQEPLAEAYDMDGAFNNVTLTLARGALQAEVIDRLDRLFRPYGGIGAYGRENQLSHEYLSQEIQQLRSMAGIVPLIFLGVAAFLLNVVITRMINEQREQIAVLKAFGYSNHTIGLHYVTLILLILAVGLLPGVIAGAWLGHGMSRIYSDFFRFPYLHYHLAPGVVIAAVGISTLAALLGALHSVRRAARLPPAQAMRPEPPARYRTTLVERLGAQHLFDQPTRMILRHLERQPFKSLLSVLGIAMAGAILMVGAFQEDAIDYMIDVQFSLAQREDMAVTFTEPASRKSLFELQALPGVQRVEPFRAVAVELRAGHRSYRTSLQGFEEDSRLHRVLDKDLNPLRLPGAGIVLTDYLAKWLEVGPGDRLIVEVLEGSQPVLEARVAGLVKEYIGVSAYMDITALNRLMREGHLISGAFLAVDERAQQRLFERLKERPRVAGISIRQVAIQSFYETMAETLLIFALVNTLLAGSIAFGVVYNSARIAFSERSRELASLRVLGFTRGEIAYILLGELAVLILVAVLLGFFIGWLFCRLIAENLTSELYRVPLVTEPSTYGFSASVVLVAAILSGILIWRKLYRLDLIAVLKTRE